MPIYEYQCAACHRTFEVWQKFSDGPAEACEHCGSPKVAKLISSSSFHLKGSGWYITDYARKGTSSSGSSDSGAKSKTESKPAKETSTSSE
jgi:putative FmdB family regulatory protein